MLNKERDWLRTKPRSKKGKLRRLKFQMNSSEYPALAVPKTDTPPNSYFV